MELNGGHLSVRCMLHIVAFLLMPTMLAAGEQVDPRSPSEWVSDSTEKRSHWMPTQIRQLEAERAQLIKKISGLPKFAPLVLPEHSGYHSAFAVTGEQKQSPHVIETHFAWSSPLDSIALEPAFHPLELRPYGFPRRFKIEVLDADTNKFESVVNWMDEDFPDPGPYPVFFADINRWTKVVRVTVPQMSSEFSEPFFSLGEIYMFRKRKDGRTGDNMVLWNTSKTCASDSLSLPPIWGDQYFIDGISGMGLPLGNEIVAPEDLIIFPKSNEPQLEDKVELVLDLGEVRSIGPIDFWPAVAPNMMALPSFGFPKKIHVEVSTDPHFSKSLKFSMDDKGKHLRRGDLVSIKSGGCKARYLRITLEGLAEYKGRRILGLGEISVSHSENVWSTGCAITAQGIPDEYLDQLPRLVDGCSRRRKILSQGEWIKGLAMRRPLDRRLEVVDQMLNQTRAEWRKVVRQFQVWGVVAVLALLAGGLLTQRWMRMRGIKKLRHQITRDLHDEVGSGLGSIALSAKRLEKQVPEGETKEELSELSLLARETSVSLREVVWVIDQNTILLSDLMQKLKYRMERVLFGVEVSSEFPDTWPSIEVSLAFKRHLIMFFKEAVYNCARHAQASKVNFKASAADGKLCIQIEDNGCGFDPEKTHDGWGVDSMKKRSEEMGGEMKLSSQLGVGTKIGLCVPLLTLQTKIDHYKTSN